MSKAKTIQPVPIRKVPKSELTPEELESKRLRDVHYHMIARCTRPSHSKYKNYGARGIKVCSQCQGKDGLKQFCQDMGERPTGYTIERRDNDGDYSPDNCYWAPHSHQQRNKRTTRKLQNGVSVPEAAELAGIPRKVLQNRLERGWNEELAASCPVGDFYIKPQRIPPYSALIRLAKNDLIEEFMSPTHVGYAHVTKVYDQVYFSWIIGGQLYMHSEPTRYSARKDADEVTILDVQHRAEAIARALKRQLKGEVKPA